MVLNSVGFQFVDRCCYDRLSDGFAWCVTLAALILGSEAG